MAFDLGFLAQAGMRGLAGYRQGQRLAREDETAEAERLFGEWAKRRSLQLQQDSLNQQEELRRAQMGHQSELAGLRAQTQKEIQEARDEAARARAEMNLSNRPIQIGMDGKPYALDAISGQVRPIQSDVRFPIPGQGGAAAAGPRPRNVPSGEAEKIAGVKGLIDIATSAQARMKGLKARGINASGPVYGRLGGLAKMMGRVPPEVVDLWSSLSNIGSREMLERSGAAVTPQEFARLEPHLPSQNDPEEVLMQKLDSFIREVRLIQEHRLNSLEDANYDMGRYRARDWGAGAPSPSPGAPPPDPDAEWLKNYRARRKP